MCGVLLEFDDDGFEFFDAVDTDGSGQYAFTGLDDGTYRVSVDVDPETFGFFTAVSETCYIGGSSTEATCTIDAETMSHTVDFEQGFVTLLSFP